MNAGSFLPAAREDLLQAARRYDAEAPGLGAELAAEVERAVQRILAFPEHGSPYLTGTRRVTRGRFPFGIVYQPQPDGVIVVAIAHHRRRPGYWRGRV